MADSHFGKASTFRKAGIAVPRGTTSRMLQILSEHVKSLNPDVLIVLGDFAHSNVSAQHDFETELLQWRQNNSALRLQLIKGNHDRRAYTFYDRLAIEIPNSKSVQSGPFDLCHSPNDAPGDRFILCGHLHPAIRLNNVKLPCFWIRENQLVLPAFGEFTGTSTIDLAAPDCAVIICEQSLAVVSPQSDQRKS